MIVKVISNEDGTTRLYESKRVGFDENPPYVTAEEDDGIQLQSLVIRLEDGGETEFVFLTRRVAVDEGPVDATNQVYVMNDAGKTVEARYW